MKRLLILFFVLLGGTIFSEKIIGQDNVKTDYLAAIEKAQNDNGDYKNNWAKNPYDFTIFIENKGQFDKEIPGNDTKIEYGIQFGMLKAFFTKKGLVYQLTEPNTKGNAKERELEKGERAKRVKEQLNDETDEEDQEERVESIVEVENNEPQVKYLNLVWEGANPNVTIVATDKRDDYYTYSVGINGTITANIFRKITYKNLYPNIDVEYCFPKDKEGIKYNIILHPGADLSKVKLNYQNANRIVIDSAGNAQVKTIIATFTDHTPVSYYQEDDSKLIKTKYVIDGNTECFVITGSYNHSKTIVIDPWSTSPAMATYNQAYEVDWDIAGNVYAFGSWTPAKLVKFNSSGTVQWTYNASTLNTEPVANDPSFGDLAVDHRTGMSYICEGFKTGGAKIVKVNTSGSAIATSTGNANFQEMWRLAYNFCSNSIVIGGGGTNAPYQAATIDTSLTTLTIKNVLGAGATNFYHDMCLTAIDPTGTKVYMASANTCCDGAGHGAYDDQLLNLPLPGLTPVTNNVDFSAQTYFVEDFVAGLGNYMTWSGVPTNGYNGMAVSPNAVYVYDGGDLYKYSKACAYSGTTRNASASTQSWAGLDVDPCDNVYIGISNAVKRTSLALPAFTAVVTPSGTVFDVKLGMNYATVYVAGNGFVQSLAATTTAISIATTTVAAADNCSCDGQATVTPTLCGAGIGAATYLWSNGQTTQTATGLCSGLTYMCTITPPTNCNYKFYQSVTVPATANTCILPVELVSFSGKCANTNKTFDWETSTETNNKMFVLEHSKDCVTYDEFLKVNGAGNSSTHKKYKASHSEESKDYKYYRLKQVDNNGGFKYSKAISVACKEYSLTEITVFPNPANNNITLGFNSTFEDKLVVEVIDVLGRTIKNVDFVMNGGSNEVTLNVNELANGVYYLRVGDLSGNINTQIIKFSKQSQ